MQLKQLVVLSPPLSSPLSSFIPPSIIRGTLYCTYCTSPQESFPVTADLQGRPAESGHKHGLTLQLEILTVFALRHPPLLPGRAPVAQLRLCPVAAGDWLLIRKRAEEEKLESRWREGEQQLAARWSPGSPARRFVNTLSA